MRFSGCLLLGAAALLTADLLFSRWARRSSIGWSCRFAFRAALALVLVPLSILEICIIHEGQKPPAERDAAAVRQMYPAFSPEEELRDEDFCRLIAAGVDARTAYEVRHREELLRQAMRYAAERAAGQAARSIASGGRRVRENRGGSSCVSRPDPRKLSSEELADIRRRVQGGEKIRF